MDELLAVDQLAQILGMHPRTVRRYLREGQLKGTKVGGEWRVHQRDAEALMGAHAEELGRQVIDDVEGYLQGFGGISGKFQVCAILDCFVENQQAYELGQLIIRHVTEDEHSGPVKFQYIYDKAAGRGRYVLWGNPGFVGRILLDAERANPEAGGAAPPHGEGAR